MVREDAKNQRRGVVVGIRGRHSILLTEDGSFVEANIGTRRIGEEAFLPQRHIFAGLAWRLGAVVAAASVAIALIAQPFAYAATVAYVSVQINPGVSLGVSESGLVTSSAPQDKDAVAILSGLRLVGENLDAAVSSVITAAVDKKLVTKGKWVAYVLTAYPANNSQISQSLKKDIATANSSGAEVLKKDGVPFSNEVLMVPRATVEKAKAKGVEVGTYVVYKQLEQKSSFNLSLSLPSLAKNGLTNGIVKSGEKKIFEQETENKTTNSNQADGVLQQSPPGADHKNSGQDQKKSDLNKASDQATPQAPSVDLPSSSSDN